MARYGIALLRSSSAIGDTRLDYAETVAGRGAKTPIFFAIRAPDR
jgi:hypothetical protein